MIYFHKSPNLDDLVNVISRDLVSDTEKSDPFSNDLIVVQNRETQGWLQTEISRRNGIAANLRFVFPSELIWFFFRHFQPDLPNELPSDRLALEIRIFELFSSSKEDIEGKGLFVPENIETRLTLAESISDVFDLYQVYRPEMLSSWENRPLFGKGSIVWQSFLWNRLVEDISSEFDGIPFRHHIPELLKEHLIRSPESLPGRIFIFGVSHWSKSFNDIAKHLSKFSSLYWYDQDVDQLSGNYEHLEKWGDAKREIIQLFNSSANDPEVCFYPSDQRNRLLPLNGITLHSCHSEEREVQVLKQELFAQFDQHQDLTADDILIMVPDLELYSSHIEKEFIDVEAGISLPVYFSSTEGITTGESILKLLDFFLGKEKVSDFLELISLPLIRDGFELDEEVFQFVRRAFSEMNIHYGLVTSDSDYSIEKGINQLYLGYALSAEPVKLYDDFVPISIHSTGEVLDTLTKISSFFRYLVDIKSSTLHRYSIKDWLSQLKIWTQSVQRDETSSYFRTVDRLMNQAVLGGSKTRITFSDFVKWLGRHQSDSRATSTRRGSGITVSSYIPYRNIPFKFVGILGFNEHVFPRKPFRPEFDLIHAKPEPGDRITEQDDELLFLERLLSTNQKLHLSFIGEGERGKMPSSIITRLRDELPDLEVKHHQLHGFIEAQSSNGVLYPSLDTRIAASILNTKDTLGEVSSLRLHREFDKNIALNDLIDYFGHPSKYLASKILKVKNAYEEIEVTDRETFELDGLQKFKLREILEQIVTGQELNPDLKQYLNVLGILPNGLSSSTEFNDQLDQVKELERRLTAYNGIKPQRKKVEIIIGDFFLDGELTNYFKKWRIEWGLGSVKSRKIISAWIGHLASQISFPEYSGTMLFGISHAVVQEFILKPVDSPKKILKTLIEFYTSGDQGIEDFSCIPELSRIYTESLDSESKMNAKLEHAWFSTDFNHGEDADFFNRMIWKAELPWESAKFKKQSETIWKSILDHLEVKN